MSFGLSRGRQLDVAPGAIGVTAEELGPLPDEILTDPQAGWINVSAWFSKPDQPLEIEIGSGKGTFILEQAQAQPNTNFLGFEWAREFYAYTADRIRRRALENVRMLNVDATEFLQWRCPSECAKIIHLYFSDPWPKSRHHKKRVLQDQFLADAWRVLQPDGQIRIVTDHEDYWHWMEEHFARWTAPDGWKLLPNGSPPAPPTDAVRGPFERLPFERLDTAGEGELVGTNFERKYEREGRPFHACVLRKSPR